MPSFFGPALWCMIAAALFGISPAGCKILLGEVDPLALASLLYLGAGFATLPFSFQRAQAPPQRTEYLRLGGAVLFGGVLGPILLLIGLQQSGAGTTSLLLNMETVATVILGWLLFRENVGREVFLSCMLVVAGGVWLTIPDEMAAAPGAFWVVLACFCWGLDNHLTAVIDGFTPAQTTCIKGIGAGSCSAAIAFGMGQNWGGAPEILGGLGIGALCYGASLVLYVSSAQQLGATRSQMIFASAPYWGLAIAWVALKEPFQIQQLGGAVLMIAAMWILYREKHSHTHQHKAFSHIHWHHHHDGHHEDEHHQQQHTRKIRTFFGWHIHHHSHQETTHSHEHRDDLHHRHH